MGERRAWPSNICNMQARGKRRREDEEEEDFKPAVKRVKTLPDSPPERPWLLYRKRQREDDVESVNKRRKIDMDVEEMDVDDACDSSKMQLVPYQPEVRNMGWTALFQRVITSSIPTNQIKVIAKGLALIPYNPLKGWLSSSSDDMYVEDVCEEDDSGIKIEFLN